MKNKDKRLGLREITQIGQEAEESKSVPNAPSADLAVPDMAPEIELTESDFAEEIVETDKEKTFEIDADLLYIDNEHQLSRHALYSRCVPVFTNPVTVVNSTNTIIGSSVLETDGKILTCKIFIDYATPERLDIENETPVYAHIIGHSRVETWATKNRIREIFIDQVMLTNGPTFDPRIAKITKS